MVTRAAVQHDDERRVGWDDDEVVRCHVIASESRSVHTSDLVKDRARSARRGRGKMPPRPRARVRKAFPTGRFASSPAMRAAQPRGVRAERTANSRQRLEPTRQSSRIRRPAPASLAPLSRVRFERRKPKLVMPTRRRQRLECEPSVEPRCGRATRNADALGVETNRLPKSESTRPFEHPEPSRILVAPIANAT